MERGSDVGILLKTQKLETRFEANYLFLLQKGDKKEPRSVLDEKAGGHLLTQWKDNSQV